MHKFYYTVKYSKSINRIVIIKIKKQKILFISYIRTNNRFSRLLQHTLSPKATLHESCNMGQNAMLVLEHLFELNGVVAIIVCPPLFWCELWRFRPLQKAGVHLYFVRCPPLVKPPQRRCPPL